MISIKLFSNLIEIAFWHGCSPVNLLHIFRTPFYKNTYEGLLQLLLLRAASTHFVAIFPFTPILFFCRILEIIKIKVNVDTKWVETAHISIESTEKSIKNRNEPFVNLCETEKKPWVANKFEKLKVNFQLSFSCKFYIKFTSILQVL